MHFEQLRAVWQQHLGRSLGRSEVDLVARLLEQFALDFERKIRRRDMMESAAALAAVVLFGLAALRMPTIVGKLGCLIVVAWAVFIIVKLRRARRVGKRPAESLPLLDFFSEEREHLVRQIRLLRSVAWWYISPCLLGANLVFWANSRSTIASVSYLVGTLLFGLFIWWLNRRAVRLHLQPMLDEIDRVTRELTSEDPIGPDSLSR
jgi:hypothetical protein